MNKNQIQQIDFPNFTWIDALQSGAVGLDDLAKKFDLNYYQITDSLERGHLPKFEKLPQYNFLILRAITADIASGETTVNKLSNKIAFFYNEDKLITIHRSQFGFLDLKEQTFKSSQDCLLHIISSMIATYNQPLLKLEEEVESFEKSIFLKGNSKVSLEQLYFLKSQTRIIKKVLQLSQNVVQQIEVDDKHKTALQDIKDSLLSLVLGYDEILENTVNLLNSYHSVNAQRSNDVMKLLTIFSAFFLPLTFIAGIYGMNFNNMPELNWEQGYFATLGLMLLIAVIIFVWFKRKKII